MALVKRQQPRLVAFSNSEIQTYVLELTCGLTAQVNASHAMQSDNLYLFQYQQLTHCFAEVHRHSVTTIKRLARDESRQATVFSAAYHPSLTRYRVTLPDDHQLFVIASDDTWNLNRACFRCHDKPFVSIDNARACKFALASWDRGPRSAGIWRVLNTNAD